MGRYDNIINLPHHVSDKRSRMSQRDRAAQFSPFAALTGYDDKIDETARLTDEKAELTEDMKAELDYKTSLLLENINEMVCVKVVYFTPDSDKQGGAYQIKQGTLRRIDTVSMEFIFTDGFTVKTEDIYSIESDLFKIKEID
ncbi:MAG: hypothetical protein IJZ72_01945 [Oscillospiraceae bacterium]|nr:hypothetical protein [Oscillospiraceae bacterium]